MKNKLTVEVGQPQIQTSFVKGYFHKLCKCTQLNTMIKLRLSVRPLSFISEITECILMTLNTGVVTHACFVQ